VPRATPESKRPLLGGRVFHVMGARGIWFAQLEWLEAQITKMAEYDAQPCTVSRVVPISLGPHATGIRAEDCVRAPAGAMAKIR
jgi:hypothetical protein